MRDARYQTSSIRVSTVPNSLESVAYYALKVFVAEGRKGCFERPRREEQLRDAYLNGGSSDD
jgi:hypothetical protein